MKSWALAAIAALAASLAFAQPATTVVRDSDLRADKLPDAAVVGSIARGAPVRLLARFGGWAQVETTAPQPVRGWLRAGALDGSAPLASAAGLPSGRATAGVGAVTLGIRGTPSAARWHAIVVTASPPGRMLQGLAADRASMAQVLGAAPVQWASVRQLDGSAATADRLLAEIADVARTGQPGEGLFLHFAGAGTRIASGTGCHAALQVGQGTLDAAELGTALHAVAERGMNYLGAYDADFEPAGPRFSRQGDYCTQRRVAFEDAVAAAAHATGRAFAQWRLAVASADDPDDGGSLTEALRDCVVGTGAQPGLADAPAGAIGQCMSARIAPSSSRASAHGPAVRTQGSTAWSPWRDPADQWGR